jgi:hypothetical protein
MKTRSVFWFYFLFFPLLHFSQTKWDTTKYVMYKDRLVVTLFTSWRQFDYSFDQNFTTLDSGKSETHYLADANSVSGFQLDYDKLSLSISFKSAPSNVAIKGNTVYKNFNFSFGGNKWILETSYRDYKGFYDLNTASYDTSFKRGNPYFQIPSMQVQQTKAKFMYFANHKNFAYKSGYSYTCRQLKSAFSWVYGGNIYQSKHSVDSSFFSPVIRKWYDREANLNRLNVVGISAGIGASWNLVLFKRFFSNLTFNLYAEPQWRTYQRTDGSVSKLCYFSSSGDARFSFGYNGRNFFIALNSFNDFVYLNSTKLNIVSKFISGSFSYGYRFKVKSPKIYDKFKATKLYQLI